MQTNSEKFQQTVSRLLPTCHIEQLLLPISTCSTSTCAAAQFSGLLKHNNDDQCDENVLFTIQCQCVHCLKGSSGKSEA